MDHPYHLGLWKIINVLFWDLLNIHTRFHKNRWSRFGGVLLRTLWHENFLYEIYIRNIHESQEERGVNREKHWMLPHVSGYISALQIDFFCFRLCSYKQYNQQDGPNRVNYRHPLTKDETKLPLDKVHLAASTRNK